MAKNEKDLEKRKYKKKEEERNRKIGQDTIQEPDQTTTI